MQTNEVISMCQRLARKYNAPQHYQDLVQEGILVCYEILDKEDCTHPAKLYREANRRMHDFLNLDVLPVSVSAHNITRKISRGQQDQDTGNMSDLGHKWLKIVLNADAAGFDEEFITETNNTVEMYEKMQYEAYVVSVAITSLSATEWQIIKLRYFEDLTQDEVAIDMKSNKMWVSRHEKVALDKLKNKIM
jgi:RNA polymerase sigma factor (sigma-70 family)